MVLCVLCDSQLGTEKNSKENGQTFDRATDDPCNTIRYFLKLTSPFGQ